MKKLLQISIAMFAILGATSAVQAQAQATTSAAAAGSASVQSKVAMCIGCHGIAGYQSSFPEIHKVPMIAGQNAKYIGAALTAYAKGERKHPTMKGIAASLSDQDIADVAAFYAQQTRSAAK